MSFDLDYRPRRFSDVLGNDGVKRLLLTRSRAGTLAGQSMMFGGPKGCGKTSLARIVARAIKCSDLQDGEPCGECASCASILDETSPDVQELDAASQGTVDRIREMIRDADFGTFDGTDVRVYLVDEAQRLSKAAQDAFLAALESRLFVVIMCTTEPGKILGTIRDRVEEYPVHAPSQADVEGRLRKVCSDRGISADPEALSSIVTMCARTPRTSLLSLEAMASLGPVTLATVGEYYRLSSYEAVVRFLSLVDYDIPAALAALDELSYRESPTWVRDAMIDAVTGAQRVSIGSVSRYPVPSGFFPVRGREWLTMAKELGAVDRPSMADIEAIVLSGCPAVPLKSSVPFVHPESCYAGDHERWLKQRSDSLEGLERDVRSATSSPAPDPPASVVALPTSPVPPPPPPPASTTPPAPKSTAVEIEGIVFSKEEKLTSLDRKIVKTEPAPERASVRVELDKSRAPQSEGEFSSAFRRRLGRP